MQCAPAVSLTLPQGTAVGLGQARGWGDAAALRVHPGIDVVGDIAPRDTPRRVHRQYQLLGALESLEREGYRVSQQEGGTEG